MDTSGWREFFLKDICRIYMGNKLDFINMTSENPTVNFVGRSADDNGVAGCVDEIPGITPYRAGCLTVALGGSLGCTFLQTRDFYTSQNVSVLELDGHVSPGAKLFLATMIMNECKYKYVAFGRELNVHIRTDFSLYLPAAGKPGGGYAPDWDRMEAFMSRYYRGPLRTGIRSSGQSLAESSWKTFQVRDLFDVEYGINMELNACTPAEGGEAVNFVGRTETNNGVTARVRRIEGKEPQPAGTITCAGGGSVLSTFLQPRPFYSGRDLYLLKAKEEISDSAKLFFITVLKANRYRYNYGRQANKTLPYLEVRLPQTPGGSPDWAWMERYMNSLPYSDLMEHTGISGKETGSGG